MTTSLTLGESGGEDIVLVEAETDDVIDIVDRLLLDKRLILVPSTSL